MWKDFHTRSSCTLKLGQNRVHPVVDFFLCIRSFFVFSMFSLLNFKHWHFRKNRTTATKLFNNFPFHAVTQRGLLRVKTICRPASFPIFLLHIFKLTSWKILLWFHEHHLWRSPPFYATINISIQLADRHPLSYYFFNQFQKKIIVQMFVPTRFPTFF